MFGGSPQTAGFLDIQWADIVFILVLRGSIRSVDPVIIRYKTNYIVQSSYNPVLSSPTTLSGWMWETYSGIILYLYKTRYYKVIIFRRFDTMNSSGLWNQTPQSCEVIVIAHE